MDQVQTLTDRVIYENKKFDIRIFGKSLSAGDETYALRSISAASLSTKTLPLWPGVVLLLWGIGVFINDSLPVTPGVEQNHPLFKFSIIIAAGLWMGFRSNSDPKFDVRIKIDGSDVRIARCSDQMEAVEILTQVNNAL